MPYQRWQLVGVRWNPGGSWGTAGTPRPEQSSGRHLCGRVAPATAQINARSTARFVTVVGLLQGHFAVLALDFADGPGNAQPDGAAHRVTIIQKGLGALGGGLLGLYSVTFDIDARRLEDVFSTHAHHAEGRSDGAPQTNLDYWIEACSVLRAVTMRRASPVSTVVPPSSRMTRTSLPSRRTAGPSSTDTMTA